MMVQTRGVFGMIFNDFGADFTVYDDNGENPATGMVGAISQASSK
jgi:ubiquitin-activating enzyme E1